MGLCAIYEDNYECRGEPLRSKITPRSNPGPPLLLGPETPRTKVRKCSLQALGQCSLAETDVSSISETISMRARTVQGDS